MKEILKNEKSFYTFERLFTEYGSLYLYTKYENQRGKLVAETREFFTDEKAVSELGQLEFMGKEACFPKCIINWKDFTTWDYLVSLTPHDFFMAVSPYLVDETTKQDQILHVYDIFNQKISEKVNTQQPSLFDEKSMNDFDTIPCEINDQQPSLFPIKETVKQYVKCSK